MKSIAIAGDVQGAPHLYGLCHPLEGESFFYLDICLGQQRVQGLITTTQLYHLAQLLDKAASGK